MQRLRERWEWIRHSWWFQWAHKPLCDAYHEDVLRLGPLRLCRGCTALWVGLFAGTLWMLTVPVGTGTTMVVCGALYLVSAALSHPALHSRWPRLMRDALRIASGLILPLGASLVLRGELVAGLSAIAILVGTYALYARLRLPRRLEKCTHCPELGQGICSGYASQSVAIRAWEEAASAREHARRMARQS
jgi:hypothetical protein